MNPSNRKQLSVIYNSREEHFIRRKEEVQRIMKLGHTKKRAQQIAKSKGY